MWTDKTRNVTGKFRLAIAGSEERSRALDFRFESLTTFSYDMTGINCPSGND